MASILVVDDEEQGRSLLARILEKGGHSSRQAASAAQARTLLRGQPFELVLCDVRMPNESGLDLIREVLSQSPEIAVVMASAHDDPELVQTALDIGAYGYVLKPFRYNELLIEVSNALRRRSLEIEKRQHLGSLEEQVFERTRTLEDAVERLRRAERTARESEERFRKIFEEGPLGMATLGPDHRFIEANNTLCEMLGYTQQELKQLTLRVTHPEDIEREASLAGQLFRGEIARFKIDKRYIRKNGQVFWATLSASTVRDTKGELQWGLAIVEDIDQRKQEELRFLIRHETTQVLARSGSLSEAVSKIMEIICSNLNWEYGAMWTVDPQAGVLRWVEGWQSPGTDFAEFEAISRQTAFTRGTGLPGRVWASGRPEWIPDVLQDSNFPRSPIAAKVGTRSACGFPICLGDEVLGIVEIFSVKMQEPDPALLNMMSSIGSQIGQFIKRNRGEQEVLERISLATFVADVSVALSRSETLKGMLHHCAESMVKHLDAAFARIWTLDEEENVLILKASAGMYTHTDGPHGRVPVGKFKIGLIAEERKPHLTNTAIGDSRVGDQEWAKREGMVAFAGYPLIIGNQLVGVMAMFARRELNEATIQAISSIAQGIALGIERKRAEDALLHERHLLHTLLDNIPDCIYFKDPQSRFTCINRAEAELLGSASPESAVGKRDTDFFGAGFAEEAFTNEQEMVKSGRPIIDKTEKIQTADGRTRWISATKAPIFDRNGEISGIVGISRDITERKSTEEELQRAHLAAQQAQRDLEAVNRQLEVSVRHAQELAVANELAHASETVLLAAITSILVVVDEDYRITRWNSVAESIFDKPSADAVGCHLGDCGIQWNWPALSDGISQCLRKDHPTRLDDVRYVRPGGKDGVLGITLSPIKESDGRQRGFLLLGTDITDRGLLEAQLRQAQKLESIGQLAAGIAHEINTPTQYVTDNIRFLKDSFRDGVRILEKYRELLTAARSGTVTPELLEAGEQEIQEADLDFLLEEIPKAIDQSLEGTERVSKIVRSMKEFAYPGGREKTSADLNKAIESTVTVARNEWKYVAEMVTDLDPNLPPVPCLLGDLNQVILNLIVNAAHAITEKLGKVSDQKGTITVSTRQEEDWAVIRVRDTGAGIPEHIQAKIFDPFFTTKEVGKGTGQGLAISHSVVEKHGGTIGLETQVGHGTTFVIRLPLHESVRS